MVTLLLIIAAIACLALGCLIVFQDTKRFANIIFVGICLCFGIWAISVMLFLRSTTPDSALVTAKVFYVVAALFPALLLIFALIFPKQENKISIPTLSLIGLTGLIMSTLVVVYPGFVIKDIVISGSNYYGVVDSMTYILYAVYFVVFFGIAIAVALNKFFTYRGSRRMQAGLYAIGILIDSIPGLITNLLLPYYGDYRFIWVGPAASIFFLSLTAYAIIRHGLFSVQLAAVRSTAYLFTLIALSAIYYMFAYLASLVLLHGQASSAVGVGPINIILALILAFLFQPIKHFFDRITNRLFYKDGYNVDDFFTRLNKVLAATTDLRLVLEHAAQEIGDTLKSEQTFFFIYTDKDHFVTGGTKQHKELPRADALALDNVGDRVDGVIVASVRESNDPIRRLLASHKIELVLPLIQSGEKVGYLCLGNHLNSHYTTHDMKVLNAVAGELIIAIENALSVQEVRELNDSLQQRVDDATKELRTSNAQLQRLDKAKDDFISMASHQLRTPLTSVKGYISMVREGDVGKISKDQDQMLGEAFASSERMVHLINDFLNVSRLQTGKFLIDKRPVDLAKVIEQELDSLVTNAKSRNLAFTYTPPKDFPMLNLDEDKIRQVIMNFSDNAIYYSTEGTKIKVKLAVQGKEAIFTVTDNGIGVPRAEQSQLFNKFYRASNARRQRPDGTGVGLYLAKKVIDAHDGKLVFESVEGKGSTFGFKLSLDKLAVTSDSNNLDNQNNKN